MTDRQARMLASGLVVLAGGVLFGGGVVAYGFGQRQSLPDSCQFFGAVVFAVGGVMLLADWAPSFVLDLMARAAGPTGPKAAPPRGAFPIVPVEPMEDRRG